MASGQILSRISFPIELIFARDIANCAEALLVFLYLIVADEPNERGGGELRNHLVDNFPFLFLYSLRSSV